MLVATISLMFLPNLVICAPGYQGVFWHITDIHVDQNYSKTGNPENLCHESAKHLAFGDNGMYGNFLCDSPQELLDISILSMVKIQPKPDFIIWTGDNLPHTRNPSPAWYIVLEQIKNITLQLQDAFQNVTIYPSIGNHDTTPPNMILPESNNSIYEDYFEKGGWKFILPSETWSTFRRGGYYSHVFKPGLRIISLNTILWYQSNSLVQNETDYFQFIFLKNELDKAFAGHEKVYIIGHVSPGYYNRIRKGEPSTPLYHLPYLKKYLQIIKNYTDVIAGQFFGHIHNDMFQLYYCDTGEAYGSGLLAASVTPWYSNTKKNVNVSIPVNPSIRLMYYNTSTMLLLDYEQYFLNLTEANQNTSKVPHYELLYTFDDTYGVSNLSTKSLVDVYERLKMNQSFYETFFKYLTVGKESVGCDDDCKTAQLCSIAATSENEYKLCMQSENGGSSPSESSATHTVIYVVSFLCLFIVIAVVMYLIYFKRKRLRQYNQNYDSYSNF